jgi:hypothetical protein
MARSSSDVAQNAFDDVPMDVVRIVHMKTCLLHGIRQLRSGEC